MFDVVRFETWVIINTYLIIKVASSEVEIEVRLNEIEYAIVLCGIKPGFWIEHPE